PPYPAVPAIGERLCGLAKVLHAALTEGVLRTGRLPERPKGAVCKTVGIAFVGSNPTPATQRGAPSPRGGGGSGPPHHRRAGGARSCGPRDWRNPARPVYIGSSLPGGSIREAARPYSSVGRASPW